MTRELILISFLLAAGPHGPDVVHGTSTTLFDDSRLREQLQKLKDALNKRDLETLRSQISPSRIYVEIAARPGAYLSNSQTVLVLESFIRARSGISAVFDFVTDDGEVGSASGSLTATENGRQVAYRLNFGFLLSGGGKWLLNRISMK